MKQASHRAVLLLAVVLGLVAGCSSPSGGSVAGTDPGTRTVTHALGTAEVPASPQRVVSASVTMTGHLLALDLPVIASATTRPGGGTADGNGFFVAWGPRAVEQGTVPLGGPTVDVEAVAAQSPDVIVGSAVGADAVTPEAYAQLSAIAPTGVVDHSSLSWQELSARLGADLGRADEAAAAEQGFAARAAEVGQRIDTSREAVALTITPDGYNVFTADSAQGKLLTQLGLRLRPVEASGRSGLGNAGQRRDAVPVAQENAGQFGDASLFVVNATDEQVEQQRARQPLLATLPAFTEGRVYGLGPESFRLDRFAADAVLDRLEASAG
ncbi:MULTISPECIES: Fe2+-enterobactin ABC transporter substrate-binding protein [unclassified Pseudonocardia]|uniref:Fe2+-enterobactin ABC transporter substrate-binding protein n=1 Tax=unclassified Pseudonocardia TaxID=2619320 RepID=UPI0005252888|nr:Fe2+-enterobactin ABC transporter substrate-binding protein [Pseudonocardia sp. Ae707_Ps1]